MPVKSILETVGNTPLVELSRINPNSKVKIYAKLEGFNPSGSLKDRIVKSMIEDAERRGELTKERILLEPTSGNTGISMAMFAQVKGYKLTAVMPENVSRERMEIIQGFGARLVLTEGEKGTNGAIEVARRMAQEDKRFLMLDQYSNQNNTLAHYQTTAVEILREVPRPDIFIAGLGTGGTLMGVGRRLKETNPQVKIIAVQPYPKGGLAGLRNVLGGFIPPILDMGMLDASEPVTEIESFKMLRDLVRQEGIFGGISSGAVMHVALMMAQSMREGTIVVVLADGGWRYVSERILTEDLRSLSERFPGPLW
jgi:cysteine synthase B